jgi:flagellar basal body L-ring protein FlgH
MNRRMLILCAAVCMLTAGLAGDAAAQAPADTARQAVPPPRASWLTDRMPLRVGDLITVIVDEQTYARERVSNVATAKRSQRNDLSADVDAEVAFGKTSIQSGVGSTSQDVGEAGRQGDLSTTITARVVSVDAGGIASIEGTRNVAVDGRRQEVVLRGAIRAEDVSAGNTIHSSRIAGADITYKGKKIGPRMGIFGKILSIIWP